MSAGVIDRSAVRKALGMDEHDFVWETCTLSDSEMHSWMLKKLPLYKWAPEWCTPEQRGWQRKMKTATRIANRNAAPEDRIAVTWVPGMAKSPPYTCPCGSSELAYDTIQASSRLQWYCADCHRLAKPPTRPVNFCIYEESETSQARPEKRPEVYTRWKSLGFWIRRWQGLSLHKAKPHEFERIRQAVIDGPGLENVTFEILRGILHTLGDLNHVYSDIYSLLDCLGHQRQRLAQADINRMRSHLDTLEDPPKDNRELFYILADQCGVDIQRRD